MVKALPSEKVEEELTTVLAKIPVVMQPILTFQGWVLAWPPRVRGLTEEQFPAHAYVGIPTQQAAVPWLENGSVFGI